MKNMLLLLAVVGLAGCLGKPKDVAVATKKDVSVAEKDIPVYKVDLEHLDSVSVFDLFSRIEVVPLETNPKTQLASAEFGVHRDRILILDKLQGLCFGFGMDGKFKYVTENKARIPKNLLPDGSVPVDASQPFSYYHDLQWHCYLTYRPEVFTMDKEGNRTVRYSWDFGEHSRVKSAVPNYPKNPKSQLALLQKDWMQDHASFALSEAKQNEAYIYTLVDRIFLRSDIFDKSKLTHLFCHKPSGKVLLFDRFTEGVELSAVTRMNDTCLLAMVWHKERDRYVKPELLDAVNLQRFEEVKPNDNPMILKYYFRREK